MSFRIDFAAEAERDFAKAPPLVASSLLDGLDALSALSNPYEKLVRGFVPYRAKWIFQHRCEADGERWICNVSVAVDEDALVIHLLWIHPQKVPDYDWR